MSDDHIHVNVRIPGAVLPGWVVIVFASCLVFAGIGCILSYWQLAQMTKEVRILELHTQDIESKMIELGIAHRDDFAEWYRTSKGTRPPERDRKEK